MTKYPELEAPLFIYDMDGTSVNFSKDLDLKLERVLPPEAFATRKIHEYWIEDAFEEKYHNTIYELLCEEGFFLNMEPIPGAIEAIHEMLDEKLRVMICTTPHPESMFCIGEKTAWVKKYLGKEFVKHMIFTQDKTIIHADVLIDDKPEIHGYNKSPSWTHVLFGAVYNQHVDTPHRLNDWTKWREVIYPILENPK